MIGGETEVVRRRDPGEFTDKLLPAKHSQFGGHAERHA